MMDLKWVRTRILDSKSSEPLGTQRTAVHFVPSGQSLRVAADLDTQYVVCHPGRCCVCSPGDSGVHWICE